MKFTTLSVVTNQGWMIPYLGCMIVATGLAGHFLGLISPVLAAAAIGDSCRATVGRGALGGGQPALGAGDPSGPHSIRSDGTPRAIGLVASGR